MENQEEPGFLFDEEDTGTSHDPSEFDDPEADAEMAANNAAAATRAAEATLKELTTPPKVEDVVDLSYMTEVDRRLDVASYYRQLLTDPLFEGGGSSAQVVEREVRQFVTERLQVLLAMKADNRPIATVVKSPFEQAEVLVLKSLVAAAPAVNALSNAFTALELKALKELATVALKHKGIVAPPAAQAAAGPRPALKPKAPPVAVALPKPAPVPPPAPVAPPAPAKPAVRARRVGRPAAPAPAPQSTAPSVTKVITRDVDAGPNGDGGAHTTVVQRIQRPAGMVPFPSTDQAMQAATAVFASIQSETQKAHADNPSKTGAGMLR
jgi:hypothetical protein